MRREELYLHDIFESISAIEGFLQNVKKDEFLVNELLQSAVLYKIIIIGEASARLSDELKASYAQTPWTRITGLRNIAAHAYFSIDWEAIWSTVINRLMPLREEITEILENEFPNFDFGDTN